MALPLASDSGAEGLAVLYTATTFGFQDLKLWFPDTFAVSGPARVEFGDELIGSLDGELAVLFDAGKLRSGTDAYLTVAPGVGYYFDKTFLLGVRLPLWWGFTDKGDNAQVALEPYLRGDLGQGFLNARFTMNLDEPLGFAFNRGKVWGLHFGGGFVF
jgi:hypothetical protein